MEPIEREVIIEDNHTLERYFSKNERHAEQIRASIMANLLPTINERPHKIKTVRNCKYRGKTIYEYKVVVDPTFECRASFVYLDDKIVVFFISNTLRKSAYVRLVAKVSGVSKVS